MKSVTSDMMQIPDAAVQAAMDATSGNIPPVMLESALTAALPHLQLGYEVKKLEWKLRANGGFTCIDDNEYCIDFWENEQLYVGSYTTMERSKNADDVKEALQKKFERRVRECVVAKPVEVLDDASMQAKVSEIGNQIHNLGCEHQNDEALTDRLRELRDQLWDISKNYTKPVDVAAVTKPVTNIECRTPQEVFDIMCDRIRFLSAEPAQGEQWRDIATAPRTGEEIIYLTKYGEIGFCKYTFAINEDEDDFWWDFESDADVYPEYWLPRTTLPAAPTTEAER